MSLRHLSWPAVLLIATALAGCGSSSSSPAKKSASASHGASTTSSSGGTAPASSSTASTTPTGTSTSGGTSTTAGSSTTSGTSATASTGASSVPAGAVADVAGTTIPQSQFNHWLQVIVYSNAAQNKVTPLVPDPPSYDGCIAAARKQPKLAKQPTSTLRDDCRQLDQVDNQEVLDFLIKSIWLEAAGNKAKVTPTAAQVKLNFQHQKTQEFKSPAQFAQFLAQSRQTEADIELRIKTSRIETLLAKKYGGDKALLAKLTSTYKSQTKCATAYAMADCAGFNPAAAAQAAASTS